MTIRNMRYDFIADVTAKNEVLSLAISPAVKLAASVWTLESEGSLEAARLTCLQHALDALRTCYSNWHFWLLASHRTVQPDNRITRYHGLWKSLVAAKIDLPQGEFIDESIVEVPGGMRIFSAVRFELDQLPAVNLVISATQAAIAFISPSAALKKVQLLTQRGWAMINTPPPRGDR